MYSIVNLALNHEAKVDMVGPAIHNRGSLLMGMRALKGYKQGFANKKKIHSHRLGRNNTNSFYSKTKWRFLA